MTDRELRHTELAARYLPDDLLERIRARAGEYDRENRFFEEDLAELLANGYFTALVPEEFGGPGLSLNQVSRLQQRLATAAPATALAVNMHFVCTGVVKAMFDRGDRSLSYVFEDAMAGEIFAFGISEPANDLVLYGSNTQATPEEDGGYLLSGVKIFTSLSPAWTRMIVHARDDSDPEQPVLVYGYLERTAQDAVAGGGPGITVSDRWDVLGMRASHSRATLLDGARMRPERVARKISVGRTPDLLTLAIAANFHLLIGSVYTGIAHRALELAATALKKRHSAQHGTVLAEVPERRIRLADAHMAYMAVPAQLDVYTRDFDDCADYGAGWSLRLISARLNAGDVARHCTEAALMCAGGSSFDNKDELSRLYRDAAASMFHPPSTDAARPAYAAALLDE